MNRFIRIVNEFLATVPFDIYQLHLFHLVVRHRSFTRAAEIAGMTQSAISRQIQNMESNLGITLLERTTRSVQPTSAGIFLNAEASRVVGDIDSAIREIQQQFGGKKRIVRIGVSRTISMSYLPGFLHANQRRLSNISTEVVQDRSSGILDRLESNELDLGVICPPSRINSKLRITHRFKDDFVLIAPADVETADFRSGHARKKLKHWVHQQSWLLLDDQSFTGQRLRVWLRKQEWKIEPQMQLDGFDLIINLVALGMGVSVVPQRALAIYGRHKGIRRIATKDRFSRELVVLIRRHRKTPVHLKQFVNNILF